MSIGRVLVKNHFLWKIHAGNVHQKLVIDPFLILVITQNSYCMQENVLKIRYIQKGLSKNLKKVKLFFFSKPIPFDEQDHEKHKEPETSDQ